jgi:pyruvate dehydrogenase E1 component alpha subunit
VEQGFFDSTHTEAEDYASDIRSRTLALEPPQAEHIFPHVYSASHPVITEQSQWLQNYLQSFEEGS